MSKSEKLNVDDAYSLKTPEDSIQLYGEWAKTYDSAFVESSGYLVYRRVAEILLQQPARIDGPVLDVGCGTGIVGVQLREGGIEEIDGIDISTHMLAEAAHKKATGDRRVYRNLVAADLTKKLDLPDDQYAGLISAGTFTHGHLGPESLDELWRVAAPGAICVIGVRDTHFKAMDFEGKLSIDVADGKIGDPDIVEARMYSSQTNRTEHADDKALIVVCRAR